MQKGAGFHFEELREYQEGDPIQWIDWNVTARIGSPYVKQWQQEKEMHLVVFIDQSSSMRFASKDLIASEISTVLLSATCDLKGHIGFLCFSNEVHFYSGISSNKKNILSLLHRHSFLKKGEYIADPSSAWSFFQRHHPKEAICFVITDASLQLEKNRDWIGMSAKYHLVFICLYAPEEYDLPEMGLIHLQDAETGQVLFIDSSCNTFKQKFKDDFHAKIKAQKKIVEYSGGTFISLDISLNPIETLVRFLISPIFRPQHGKR